MFFHPLFDLNGRTAIITGALGTIGQAYAKKLAEFGAGIVLVDKNPTGAEELISAIQEMDRQAEFFALDVTDVQAVQETVQIILQRFEKIDILVNHAGINIRKPALDYSENEWDRVLNVNLKGMFFMAQAVGKEMVARGSGKIINTASVSSVRGHPRLVAYAASKGAVVQMTKVLAKEWAPYNVQVNAIGPGYIRTQQTEEFLRQPAVYQDIVSKIPMGRVGNPEDLVGGCIFLASRASDYITGQTIYIEGGRLID